MRAITALLRVSIAGALLLGAAFAAEPFRIEIVDETTGRGVPLVELETMANQLFVTDSAGRAAFAEPGQMGVPIFFSMRSHGYAFPTDGFGFPGAKLTPQPGGLATVKAKRLNIAERICRLTGQGIYRDSVLLGAKPPLAQPLGSGGVAGQDSVHAAVYRGRIFWLWGDTMRMSYPLGNFRTASAWSELPGKGGLAPAQGVNFQYITGKDGFAREMAPLGEKGALVWLDGLSTVGDDAGRERLVARYTRRQGMQKLLEQGIAVFDDEREVFESAGVFPVKEPWRILHGQTTPVREGEIDYLYFGDVGLHVRVPARLPALLRTESYEAWTCADAAGAPRRRDDGALDYAWRKDVAPMESPKERRWLKQALIKAEECRVSPAEAATGERVTLHRGSVRWNEYRKRWVLIAVQEGGKSSYLGEVWYAEAAAPTGPWKSAIKIATHDRYSFYNPVQHSFFDEEGGRLIYFEGTYSHTFSGREGRTPYYDYNQMLYRLDLADARLKAAQE